MGSWFFRFLSVGGLIKIAGCWYYVCRGAFYVITFVVSTSTS